VVLEKQDLQTVFQSLYSGHRRGRRGGQRREQQERGCEKNQSEEPAQFQESSGRGMLASKEARLYSSEAATSNAALDGWVPRSCAMITLAFP